MIRLDPDPGSRVKKTPDPGSATLLFWWNCCEESLDVVGWEWALVSGPVTGSDPGPSHTLCRWLCLEVNKVRTGAE
jgi:hypothetical protein